MKVIQLIRGLDIGGDSGGAEVFAAKLAIELKKTTLIDSYVCAFYELGTATEKKWLKILKDNGVTTVFAVKKTMKYDVINMYKGFKYLERFVIKEGISRIQSHFQLGSLLALLLKKKMKSGRIFRTIHITDESTRGFLGKLANPIFIQYFFPKFMDGEMAVSQAVFKQLVGRKLVNPSKVFFIPNGIDEQSIQDLSLQKIDFRANPKDFNVLGVGRLATQKGYSYLIQAIAMLKSNIPHIKLYLVGDGPETEKLKSLSNKIDVAKYVVFLGVQENVPAIMKQMDLFVLPSLWEGLPTVILEAMECELPVIATEIPGTTELISHMTTGLLVEPYSASSLRQGILEFYDTPMLRNTLVSNSKLVVRNYTIQQIAKKYAGIYNN